MANRSHLPLRLLQEVLLPPCHHQAAPSTHVLSLPPLQVFDVASNAPGEGRALLLSEHRHQSQALHDLLSVHLLSITQRELQMGKTTRCSDSQALLLARP